LGRDWFYQRIRSAQRTRERRPFRSRSPSAHIGNETQHQTSRPTPEDFTNVAADLEQRHAQLIQAETTLKPLQERIFNDDRCIQQSKDLQLKRRQFELSAAPWRKLTNSSGSPKASKFRAIAQRRTLDILLTYANAQLDLFANRYKTERLPEIPSATSSFATATWGDEKRSVHSSGGESSQLGSRLGPRLPHLKPAPN